MELLDAVILGIVEGITEFLPVSSTGHLMLASQLLSIENIEFAKSFDIIIQLGAILAVVVLYPKRLLVDKETITRVAAAFIPTAGVGLLAYPLIKSHLLGDLTILLLALALGGVAIILLEQYWRPPENKTVRDLSLLDSAKIGLLQTVAFIPGVSRSAMTIFGGMWMGLSRKESVEFSFFVAVPTMAAATGLDVIKNYEMLFASDHLLALGIGFAASFVTAMAAITLLLRFVATNDFKLFGVYRIVLALVFAWVFFF